MRPRTGSSLPALILVCCALAACKPSDDQAEHHGAASGDGDVEPGLGPRAQPQQDEEPQREAQPNADAGLSPDTDSGPQLPPADDPVLAERKQALANVGRAAFDALQAGDFPGLMHLTATAEGYLRDRCPRLPAGARDELEARFNHCHRQIAWDAVAEAQVFAGTPSGEQAAGCEDGVEDYGRLQLFLHMNDGKIWRVDFYGAVGEGGNAIGINGEVSCREVDAAPALE